MKDVKIVFIDLDGTIKNDEGKLTDRDSKIIDRLKSIGIYIIFITGRNIDYTTKLAKQYNPSSYIVCSNGAEIYNYKNDNVIYKSTINKENMEFLDNLIKKYNLTYLTNSFGKRYTNRATGNIGKKVRDSLLSIDEEIEQIVVQSYNLDDLKLFRRDLEENKNLRIVNKSTNLDRKDKPLFYDIVNSEVSKGNAVKLLCEHLKIDIEKTMCIGDSVNDLEMFEVCNYRVAMNNANEKVKEIANYVTLSNNEDGVGVVLERLYKELTK